MSDKLDWLNEHFIFLRRLTLEDAVRQENYKLNPGLKTLYDAVPDSESLIRLLEKEEKWKEGCEFISYAMHRRAAVWWVYSCLLSLASELLEVPAEPREMKDIGKPEPMEIPDWAQETPTSPEDEEKDERLLSDYQSMKVNLENLMEEIGRCAPETKILFDETLEFAYSEFEKIHGVRPMDLLNHAIEKFQKDEDPIDYENSPIFKAEKELKDKIENVRQETIDLVQSAIPPVDIEHNAKLRSDAMTLVYRWIVSPDEVNSQKALDGGNACPDTPQGLLALCAFWSSGNLAPGGEQFVPSPPGLAANGLNSVLLQAALHDGGTRKFKERYEHYFKLALPILKGKNNWSETLESKTMPHENISVTESAVSESSEKQSPPPERPLRFRTEPKF